MARRELRPDDLPEGVLYGRDKMWAVLTGPDTARVGLATPAYGGAPPRIYFLDLLPRGYLVAGKRCGGLDVDAGRVELVAPLSGRITRVNPAVLDTPELIATDPFGHGWLYEVAKVPAGSDRALMDHKRFWAYLWFERTARRAGVEPVLTAESRWQGGGPWPAHTRLQYGGRTAVEARVVHRGRNRTFTPQWQPGQRWEVEYTFEQPSLARVPPELAPNDVITARWRYEVVRLDADVDGALCYVVRAEEVADPPLPTIQLLYIDHQDFCLRLMESRNRHLPDRRSLTRNDWGEGSSYLELREPRQTIVDLPLFPEEDRDEARATRARGEPEISQWATFPNADTMHLAMEAEYLGETLRSEQTWTRGAPWWQAARRTIGDKELITGRLVTSAS
jgi:glycine cleavage system H protein